MNGAHAVILTYALDNQESFLDITRWEQHVRENERGDSPSKYAFLRFWPRPMVQDHNMVLDH